MTGSKRFTHPKSKDWSHPSNYATINNPPRSCLANNSFNSLLISKILLTFHCIKTLKYFPCTFILHSYSLTLAPINLWSKKMRNCSNFSDIGILLEMLKFLHISCWHGNEQLGYHETPLKSGSKQFRSTRSTKVSKENGRTTKRSANRRKRKQRNLQTKRKVWENYERRGKCEKSANEEKSVRNLRLWL